MERVGIPLPLNKIDVFEQNNSISVNVLVTGGGKEKLYILRKAKFDDQKRMANLLLVAQEGKRHYAMIKSLSQLLRSSNSQYQHKHYFCLNYHQGFHSEESRNKHFECCTDNEVVRIDMHEENSFVRFHSGQYQFKVPFTIYANFKVILQSLEDETKFDPEAPCMREINCHIPFGYYTYATFAYREVEDLSRFYRGNDCIEVFCNHIEEEAKETLPYVPSKANGIPNTGTAERVQ